MYYNSNRELYYFLSTNHSSARDQEWGNWVTYSILRSTFQSRRLHIPSQVPHSIFRLHIPFSLGYICLLQVTHSICKTDQEGRRPRPPRRRRRRRRRRRPRLSRRRRRCRCRCRCRCCCYRFAVIGFIALYVCVCARMCACAYVRMCVCAYVHNVRTCVCI